MYAYVLSEGLGRSLGPLGLVYITGRKNVRHDWCSVGDDDAADFQSATGPKSQNTTPYRFQPPFPGKLARQSMGCLLYTSPSPRDRQKSRMPSSA